MRKIDPKGPISQYGCISDDRNVGPWELKTDNAWKAPVWIRKGPPGYRSLYGDEVAIVSLAGYDIQGPSGLLEECGHVYGYVDDNEENRQYVDEAKIYADKTLRSFGWIVDGKAYEPPPLWQRVKQFLGVD